MLLPAIETTEPIEIIAAPAAPMKIAAPSASGVRVAARSGSTPVATSEVSDITHRHDQQRGDECERHILARVRRFAGQHAGDLVAAIGKDQQDQRALHLLARHRRQGR